LASVEASKPRLGDGGQRPVAGDLRHILAFRAFDARHMAGALLVDLERRPG
jgi:hypothetical protein